MIRLPSFDRLILYVALVGARDRLAAREPLVAVTAVPAGQPFSCAVSFRPTRALPLTPTWHPAPKVLGAGGPTVCVTVHVAQVPPRVETVLVAVKALPWVAFGRTVTGNDVVATPPTTSSGPST